MMDVAEFFRRDRRVHTPDLPPYVRYSYLSLGMQQDSFTCGFWSIWIVFMALFGINPQDARVLQASTVDLKERLSRVYDGFISGEKGLVMAMLQSAFGQLHIDFDEKFKATGLRLQDVVSALGALPLQLCH